MNNSEQIGKQFLLLCTSAGGECFFFVLSTLILKIFFNFIGTVDDGTTFESLKLY